MNNKGFAITTVLYGTFLVFIMLMLAMLGILSKYKGNMDILIESANGARDIVNPYNKGSYMMTISDRKFFKANDGVAIIGYVYVETDAGNFTGPILVSTNKDAVAYKTNCTIEDCEKACSGGTCLGFSDTIKGKDGKWYYYSSSQLWMAGNFTTVISSSDIFGWTNLGTIAANNVDVGAKMAAEKLLELKVK